MDPLAAYQLFLVGSAVACSGVAVWAWRRRAALGALKLVWLNVGAFCWTVFTLGGTVFRGTPTAWIPVRLTIPAVGLTLVALLAFTLEYTGRPEYLDWRTYALLAVEPLLASALAVTNGSHQLLWHEGITEPAAAFGYAQTFQPAFYLHTVYSYVLLVGVIVLLGQFTLRSDFLYQRQVLAIFVGLFAPWIGNVLYIFTPIRFDLTPIGFSVMAIALSWAIISADLLDITPVARDAVVDTFEAGVFVVDTNDRLVDINPRGRELLGLDDARVTGKRVTNVFDSVPPLAQRYEASTDQQEPESFEFTDGDRAYKTKVSPLFDGRDQLAGRVLLIQDITEQVERQRQLEQRNEQLDRFASVVSHDLRNPLNVAATRLDLVRRTGDEEYLDTIADAHERMARIIDDVLTLSRTDEAGIETAAVSLGTVAETAWENVDTRAASLHVTAGSSIQAHRSLLTTVFENLYRNAIEHAGEAVTITVEQQEDGFAVADDGPGISADEQEAIFEHGISAKTGGTGLGLTIVEQVADLHDWTVTVTDSAAGGARFEFTVPETAEPASQESAGVAFADAWTE